MGWEFAALLIGALLLSVLLGMWQQGRYARAVNAFAAAQEVLTTAHAVLDVASVGMEDGHAAASPRRGTHLCLTTTPRSSAHTAPARWRQMQPVYGRDAGT